MSGLIGELNRALVGRYALQREVGSGGMAVVFLAEDLKHHRHVAIKVLKPELAAVVGPERFLREIEVAARLQHPHILPLLDSGDAGGLLYYVMPYVEGESLRARLHREHQLPVKDARRLAEDVAAALDYAHRQGVVHRDIKPENVLLADGHAVVADFGIARAIAEAGGAKLTETGLTLGTPLYMSPEQVVGSGALDGRSDLYSLACMVYEMLSGEPPFTGATGASLAHQHLHVAPRRVSELRTAVPEALDRALGRALAKTAADRFPTAAEFAAAIAGDEEAAATRELPAPPPASASHRRLGAVIAALILVTSSVLVLVMKPGPLSRWFAGAGPSDATRKSWILVSDFEGPADDPGLAVTVRDLVCAALDQSGIVATVPRDQMRVALQNTGRSPETRVDVELARELAYRSGVRAVVEGKLGRLGRGYSVVLQVVDADSFRVVMSESATAKDQDALIPTLDALAVKLRKGLGERQNDIEATRVGFGAMTPSFEAYRLFLKAWDAQAGLKSGAQAALNREALALDPDFALAWMGLGVAFSNQGLPDSAILAYEEALRRPHRLTAHQRLFSEALRATAQGNSPQALAAYDRLLLNKETPGALHNRAGLLDDMGRVEEALQSLRRAAAVSPFGASQQLRFNEIRYLAELGRFEEARRVALLLARPYRELSQMTIENAAANWPEAERVGDSLLVDHDLDAQTRSTALLQLASAQAARGALRTATATYRQAEIAARGTVAPHLYENASRFSLLMLAEVGAGAIPVPLEDWSGDSAAPSLLVRGLRASMIRDGATARLLLEAARTRPRYERNYLGGVVALLSARVSALDGHWGEAVDTLRSEGARSPESLKFDLLGGATAVRWLLADAFERLGRPDSATVPLEEALSDHEHTLWETHLRGIAVPFIHRRLALLYSRAGRVEDARRHWRAYAETVRTPDPELQPLVAEARAELARLDGAPRAAPRR